MYLLSKEFVRERNSPCAVPARLMLEKDCSWRMYVDSCAINKITVKHWFLVPRSNDLLDCLHGACVFSEIDLTSGYHHIWMNMNVPCPTMFSNHIIYRKNNIF